MRLIGGNISDTPVKEIGDGSAFSVGGASDDGPDFLTLGTWGSASAISQTGWSAVLKSPTSSGSQVVGWAGGYVKLSATKFAYVWRDDGNSFQMNAATITLDSAGDFSSTTAAQDISANFPDGRTNVIARLIPGSTTGVVVYSCDLVGSPARVRIAHYEISGATFSLQNSVIIRNCGTDHNGSLNSSFLVVLDSDYGCFGNFDTTGHGKLGCIPFRFTAPQNTGSVVQSTSDMGGSWVTAVGTILDPNGTARKFYTIEPRMNSWTLSAGNPPTVAMNDEQFAATVLNDIVGNLSAQLGGIIVPPTSSVDGQMSFLGSGSHGAQPAVNPAMTTAFGEGETAAEAPRDKFMTPDDSAAKIWNHNTTFVPIDTVGDWRRGVRVGVDGTTGLHAWAQNVNVATGSISCGPRSATTNISPHKDVQWCAFDAFYDSAWSKDEIFILCEDSSGPPSYIKLPFST